MYERSCTILQEGISEDLEVAMQEVAAFAEYYQQKIGNIRHIWCSIRDFPDPFEVCGYTVELKGGVPRGRVWIW